jgi:hypothetical protein
MCRSEAAEMLCLLYQLQTRLDELLKQFAKAWGAERRQQAAHVRRQLNDLIEALAWQLYRISPN